MREKYNILLKEAYKYFKKNKFNDAIIILEKITSSETKSPYPYFLLCLSYILSDRFSEADILINRIRSINPEYLPLVQLEAFLYLKAAPSAQSAVIKYIEKLEQFPNDKHLRLAHKLLHSVDDFQGFQKDARLTDYVKVPKIQMRPFSIGKRKNYNHSNENQEAIGGYQNIKRISIILTIIIIITGALATAVYFSYPYVEAYLEEKDIDKPVPQIESFSLDTIRYSLIDKIKKKKPPIFYYSDKELLKDFKRAKLLIKKERYNEALIRLNKIGNSNANIRVVEKLEFLRRFIKGIEDRPYSDIDIRKIVHEPYLYRGIFVKWKGKVANMKRKENKLFFNLLVDYKRGDIFSGVIDVYSEKDYDKLSNGVMIELLAEFVNTIGDDNRVYLVANAIKSI